MNLHATRQRQMDSSRGTGLPPPVRRRWMPAPGNPRRLRRLHRSGIRKPRGQAVSYGRLQSFWPSPLQPGAPFPRAVRPRGSQRRAPAVRPRALGQAQSYGRLEWPPRRPRRCPFLRGWGGKITQSCFFLQPGQARSRAYGPLALRICDIGRVFCGCLRVCVCLRPGAGNKRASVKFDNNVLQRSCQDWGGRWGRKAEGVGESWSLKRRRQSAWPRYYVGRR